MKLNLLKKKFKGKRILITGNTGFVGSWLSLLLSDLGANVLGFSQKKSDTRFLSNSKAYKYKVRTIYSDINKFERNLKKLKKFKPQIIIHLASQALVIESYKNSRKTFFTNIMGTVNFFETVKKLNSVKKIIIFTSDKVYENLKGKVLTEKSHLGGIDPYSASKSCQDIISNSYKSSFFNKKINVTILRAGNIIGGGDWNINRLVPDIFKSIYNNKKLIIRNPGAIRPWQHILEILNAFILILLKKNNTTNNTAEIFNIAPNLKSNISVVKLINLIKKIGNYNNLKVQFKKNSFYETKILKLSSNKARKQLNYIPKLTLKETISLTIDWYKSFFQNRKQILKFTQIQIQSYFKK